MYYHLIMYFIVARLVSGSGISYKTIQDQSKEIRPVIFSEGVISTEQFEFGGSFSPDGKDFYFTRRSDYQGSENRIYQSRLLDNKWTKPVSASFSKDCFEFLPVISPDGNTIYFYSERPKPNDCRYDGCIWFCKKTKSGWSEPEFFNHPANTGFCMMISPALNGTIYFAGNYKGKRGIYKSSLNQGKYAEMEYLPEEINSLNPAHPFIAPDESYIIFDAQVSGRAKPELFISFNNQGKWSKAINMGAIINETKTEFAGFLSPDGKFLYFHRRKNGNGDIYKASSELINLLKKQE